MRLHKALYLVLLLPGIASYGFTVSGDIISDQTWSGGVLVTGDVIVSGGKLTIEPGTMVKFDTTNDNMVYGDTNHINMVVTGNGKINAIGTELNRITFTGNAVSPKAGDWGKMCIFSGEANCTIKCCDLSYADTGIYFTNQDMMEKSTIIIRAPLKIQKKPIASSAELFVDSSRYAILRRRIATRTERFGIEKHENHLLS